MSQISSNILLSDFSSYKIGGPAKYFAEATSVEDLTDILNQWREIAKDSQVADRVFILGGGTNVLIDDRGYDGLVILNKIKYIKLDNSQIRVGAGVLIEDVLNFCIENSLSGLEWAGGLPGTIGGAVRGNAGAFGGETKDLVFEVASLDSKTLEINKRNNSESRFGYRNSFFKKNPNEIITEVTLDLKTGNREEIEKQINEKIEYRRQRHPNITDQPNIGSTFKNIPAEILPESVLEEFKEKIKTDPFPVLPVVKLISGTGLTGERVGDIMVSPMHPNYLVNVGNGSSRDVLSLVAKIKDRVNEKYAVKIEEEVSYIS